VSSFAQVGLLGLVEPATDPLTVAELPEAGPPTAVTPRALLLTAGLVAPPTPAVPWLSAP
jgi:hypothetical protein